MLGNQGWGRLLGTKSVWGGRAGHRGAVRMVQPLSPVDLDKGPGRGGWVGMRSQALEGAGPCARRMLDSEHTVKNQLRATHTV